MPEKYKLTRAEMRRCCEISETFSNMGILDLHLPSLQDPISLLMPET